MSIAETIRDRSSRSMESFVTAVREPYMRALSLVCAAHFCSHFFGQVLPPLFPLLNKELGVPYTVLGALMAVKSATSGLMQLPAGVLVDRVGAKRMLLLGLILTSSCMAMLGAVTSPVAIGVLVVLYAIGNSVFHPTNYSILNSSIPANVMGRAFSVHNFAGQLGTGLAPVIILTLTALFDWRTAIMSAGLTGLAVAVLALLQAGTMKDEAPGRRRLKDVKVEGGADPVKPMTMREVFAHVLKTPALIYLFMFYSINSLATNGVKDFAVAGLVAAQNMPWAAAGAAASGFFFASAVGVLAGGWVADQSKRHDFIAACAYLTAGSVVALIGSINMHYMVIVFCFVLAGFVDGMIKPSRDMMIRASAPKGGTGQVFGFVFSGQAIGGIIAPITYGLILDYGNPGWTFYVSAVFMFLCMAIILISGRAARQQRAAAEVDTNARAWGDIRRLARTCDVYGSGPVPGAR